MKKNPQLNKTHPSWNDWHWQLENSDKTSDFQGKTLSVNYEFPTMVTPYYLSLVDFNSIPDDPIFRQSFPDLREIEDPIDIKAFDHEDPLFEEIQMPVPHLIRRYQDRVVLLTTNRCAVHCRFCLRKRKWKKGSDCHIISDTELSEVCAFLIKNPQIREILVSGGDPLILETSQLKEILLRLSQIPSVTIIRLGTRVPVVLPMRIDDKLAAMLADIPGLWVATHFNHPRELTTEAIAACKKLIKSGIPIINQTVLLKDINDQADILKELFSKLTIHKIKPHYLFHVDPVKGNRHFTTGIQAGLNIMRTLRNEISSLATPQFAFDLPEGGGKIPLLPDYKIGEGYETLDSRIVEYRY